MTDLIILLITGGIAGILAGLLGIGGGILIVPVLVFIFRYQGVASEIIMHMAIGTSLATIVVTSLSSIREHQAHGAIIWSIVKLITPSIILGAFFGAAVADALPSNALRLIFAPFMLLVAFQMAFGRPPKPAAIGFPIALAGTIGFIVSGWNVDVLPKWSLGYINLKATLSIVIASALTAPLGAKLTHIMPVGGCLFNSFQVLHSVITATRSRNSILIK